jgi:hypothetical protein
MGNFAVDVMWRLGIGIDSRKGTRVWVIYACSWDPPSKIVQCIFVLLARLSCYPDLHTPHL